MRKAFVGVTDPRWYEFLSSRTDLQEVNFLAARRKDSIQGPRPGGSVPLQASLAQQLHRWWRLFRDRLAASRFSSVGYVRRDERSDVAGRDATPNRRVSSRARSPGEDFTIGNVILQQPFFFTRDAWIPIPSDRIQSARSGRPIPVQAPLAQQLHCWRRFLRDRLAPSRLPSLGHFRGRQWRWLAR